MATFGKDIVKRLEGFDKKLREGGIQQFNVRTIKLDLQPKPFTGEDVRSVRTLLKLSQTLFAQFIGVSVSSVQDWEQDRKQPSGAACRLMSEIKRNPDYWRQRLIESCETSAT